MEDLVLDAVWHEDADLRGFVLVAEGRSAELRRVHGWATWVVGSRFYGEVIREPAFAPGSPLRLIAEPTNPGDVNAVGVWDTTGRILAGYLPRTGVQGVSRGLRAGEARTGVCLRESREKDGRRRAIRVLVTHDAVTLRRVDPTTLDPSTARRIARVAEETRWHHQGEPRTQDLDDLLRHSVEASRRPPKI